MKKRYIFGSILLATALGVLLFVLVRSTNSYVLPVSKFVAQASQYEGKAVRLEGTVVSDTIDWTSGNHTLIFFLQESNQKVLVGFDGKRPDPDKFIGGIQLMVSGKYRQGMLVADTFYYECPNEYKEK